MRRTWSFRRELPREIGVDLCPHVSLNTYLTSRAIRAILFVMPGASCAGTTQSQGKECAKVIVRVDVGTVTVRNRISTHWVNHDSSWRAHSRPG
jgi:hypothetical protein